MPVDIAPDMARTTFPHKFSPSGMNEHALDNFASRKPRNKQFVVAISRPTEHLLRVLCSSTSGNVIFTSLTDQFQQEQTYCLGPASAVNSVAVRPLGPLNRSAVTCLEFECLFEVLTS